MSSGGAKAARGRAIVSGALALIGFLAVIWLLFKIAGSDTALRRLILIGAVVVLSAAALLVGFGRRGSDSS